MPSAEDINPVRKYVLGLPGIDMDVLEDALTLMPLVAEVESLREAYLAKRDLCPTRFTVLRRLFHHESGSMTPADLADKIPVTRAAMTASLDGLERIGYVARSPHPTDRRMICVSLTPKGREYLERSLPKHYQLISEVFSTLSASERAAMITLYRKLNEKVRAMIELDDGDA